eukprot:TRINITY_DN2436_c0_g1_i1.p4 TRINITY_DN2436_c0_g1~~TRINITY_DN2436_c0_g1_i1.p4  ORF type:complete len:281 (+),score=120.70 TRINITY_DN2436_c0_g1_i1:1744-2586(+)
MIDALEFWLFKQKAELRLDVTFVETLRAFVFTGANNMDMLRIVTLLRTTFKPKSEQSPLLHTPRGRLSQSAAVARSPTVTEAEMPRVIGALFDELRRNKKFTVMSGADAGLASSGAPPAAAATIRPSSADSPLHQSSPAVMSAGPAVVPPTPPSPSPLTASAPDSGAFDVLDHSANDIARQMTLLDHRLFRALDVQECLGKAFLTPERSPTFTRLTEQFNKWSSWVATEILSRDKASQRASVVEHFVKVADGCREFKNFNGVFAIVAGLNLHPVSRLKYT